MLAQAGAFRENQNVIERVMDSGDIERERGTVKAAQEVIICNQVNDTESYKAKLANLYTIEDLRRVPADSADAGEIVCFSGVENITIGDTVCDPLCVEALPFARISDPTVEMTFSVNNSPFAGQEGKYVMSRNINDRLKNELLRDVSLRVTNPLPLTLSCK